MLSSYKKLEKACLDAFSPPVTVCGPSAPSAPIIIASPHSGRLYPSEFIRMSALNLASLRLNEDSYIDRICAYAPTIGLPLLKANFPRCFVDVNRSANELPPVAASGAAPRTLRSSMGLGVVPTHITERLPIYKRPLSADMIKTRLERLYFPYHDALLELTERTYAQFGRVLILDCHSMPGFNAAGQRRPDIVLGDRHGQSCRPETMAKVEALFAERSYSVKRNFPYAGGYVTKTYCDSARQIEVVQIEINRDIYVNTLTYEPKPAIDRLTTDMSDIFAALSGQADSKTLAAE